MPSVGSLILKAMTQHVMESGLLGRHDRLMEFAANTDPITKLRIILTANANTLQRGYMEHLAQKPSIFKAGAKQLGLKPAQLYRALKPERDARAARKRAQPFGTPL